MDKSKNRTDLLAAGRKRLQQFRQKKDHKGGGSNAKSSGKGSKHDKDHGDADEQARVPEDAGSTSDPSVAATQDVDMLAVSSAEEASGGARDDEGDPDETVVDGGDSRSAIPSDHQEADCPGFEQCNGESSGDRVLMMGDEASGSTADTANGMVEDHAVVPSPVLEVVQEYNGLSTHPDEKHGGECETMTSPSNLHNERDEVSGYTVDTGSSSGRKAEDDTVITNLELESAHEVDGPSVPPEVKETTTSCANLEVGFSLEENGGEGKHVMSENNKVSRDRVNEETDAPLSPRLGIARASEGNDLYVLFEAIQKTCISPSNKSEESVSHDENLELPFSNQDSFATKGEHGAQIVEERRVEDEGGTQQPFGGDDVAVASEPVGEILKGGHISFEEKFDGVKHEDSLFLLEGGFADALDSLRRHLYLTNFGKEFLQLQLAEQIELNADSYCHSSNEVSKLWGLLKEAQESNTRAGEELMQCRSELQAVALEKEELDIRCLSTKGEIEELRIRACELQDKLERSQGELSCVYVELTECRGSVEALQQENLNLAASLALETDARKKLMEENVKLASELLEQRERLLIALKKHTYLEDDLRETGACFEELAAGNLFLSSSLVVHEAKIKELDSLHLESSFQALKDVHRLNSSEVKGTANDNVVEDSQTGFDNRDVYVELGSAENPTVLQKDEEVDSTVLQKDDEVDSGSSAVLGVLKGHLEEAKSTLKNLEESIQGMYSHSMSLGRSGGKAAAPGVSKLIQAFESKTHHVDDVSDVVPLADGQSEDLFTSASKLASILKDTLNQIQSDAKKVEAHLKEDQNCRKYSEHLKIEYETQRQQNNILQVKIDDLLEKLSNYKSRINDLQNYLPEIQQSANDESGAFLSQLELLKKEVSDRAYILERERVSICGVISEAIEKLNASSTLLVSDNTDVGSLVSALVDASTTTIKSLHEKLEAADMNYDTLNTSFKELSKVCTDTQVSKELAIGLLNKYYSSLRGLVNNSCQSTGEIEFDTDTDELISENFEKLIGHLQKLLDERFHLLSMGKKRESELSNRNQVIEDLSMRCDSLGKELEDVCHAKYNLESVLMNKNDDIEEVNRRCLALTEKLEDHSLNEDLEIIPGLAENSPVVVKYDSAETGFCKSFSRLEILVAFHRQKHEEAIEQMKLSKDSLREFSKLPEISVTRWSLPLPILLQQEFLPQVSELQEKLHFLSASNLQMGNEMQILKENLSKMEEALEAAHSELQLKASELDQSEQRLASVREKLSIAVAKGKGLIVQRDSLKQSLMENSSELEKCKQELMSKEALLHEVEAKLKSCSEVERVESLESELSYIRNSATALRDSFLLKDSVLQRIEEVLEDLDLPEHFHSKDIVEKIELLARSVAGNTSLTDWDQKSSVAGSHSDAGFVVTDVWKDELPPSSSPEFDELKRKYEDLQNKLYGLAEHNDMLEQSLMERNNLVQNWEEVLNRINMPPQLKTLEPEDRIEWLNRALAEVQQERDSLQLKIENLEVSSDMLIVDVEESHKKISELSAEVLAVKSEKEFFYESLNKLRYEYLGLSEKAVQDEIDRENLRRELAELQQKLDENLGNKDHCDNEKEMQRLYDLIVSGLPDSDMFDNHSVGNVTECLEELLRKLINSYATLYMEKSMHMETEKELVSEEINLSLDKTMSKAILDDKEQELVALRLEFAEASHNVVLVKEERDAAVDKCHSLMLEIETLINERSLLQEERTKDVEKYHSLELELEMAIKQRDALLEKLNQEEQKSAAVDQCHSLMAEIDLLTNQKNSLQEEKAKDMEIYHSLLLELEATCKQRDALQGQLTQEEQKSASAREKLNVAVRKGKGLVQQRDSLKQAIEEINTAAEHLKIEHNQRVEALESEKSFLMNRLAESEHSFQDTSHHLSRVLTALHAIDAVSEVNIVDPVQKVEAIGKLCHDLHSAVVSSEYESRKSKQAAELLLAELNEVQERADVLQEELAKAVSAKTEALSGLEQFMSVHSEERKKQFESLVQLKSGIHQLRKGCFEFSSLVSNVFTKDVTIFCYVEAFMESVLKQMNGANAAELPVLASNILLSSNPMEEGRLLTFDDGSVIKMDKHFDESSIAEHLAIFSNSLHECMKECGDAKENIYRHSFSIDQQAESLLKAMQTVQRKLASQKEYSESLKRDLAGLELVIKEKETEVHTMRRNITLLYEACSNSIAEIENRKAQIVGNNLPPGEHVLGKSGMFLKLPGYTGGQDDADGYNFPFNDDCVRTMADTLLSTVKGSSNIYEVTEGTQRELKATIVDLQRELQEKDIQSNRICAELVSQIREAETVAKRSMIDLDSARSQVFSLEKQVEVLENERELLELRVNELKDCEASSKELRERLEALSDALSAKDQEIEALMQALDEEDSQMEDLGNRNKELENIVQEKNLALESLEASRSKAVSKISTTMSKFDELHKLSESLLVETENLQSQLQGRDSEISFLRQEVTRCTDDILALQETNKKYSYEIHELLIWMDKIILLCGVPHMSLSDQESSQIHVYIDILEKKIVSIVTELDDLRMKADSKDALLQIERSRVEELSCKAEVLETSLREKETQIELFQGRTDSVQQAIMTSPGSLEIEQVRDKVTLGQIKTHVRGGRKFNNDQIAIAIDTEQDGNVLEDEDDDKAHGFKSLTMSRIVPRATRPITDIIDGIWVSGERLLMRQPTLRLGLIIYWIALHILLASVI